MISNFSSPASTDPKNDLLANGPPVPALRSAKPGAGGGGGSGGGGAGSAHLLGAGGSPIAAVMGDMMEIQKRIASLAQVRPDIAALFGPVIGQARDMMAGSLADLAQGGTGMPPQDAGMPPPQMGGAPPGAGPGPGGGGGPGGMPPPPPM